MTKNKADTIIDGNDYGDVITITSNDCTVQNLNIRNSGYYAGVKISSDGNTLDSNILNDNYYGIWVNASSDNTISNNIISSNRGGIRIRDTSNTQITDNQILSNDIEGVTLESSYYITILRNTFESNGITITGEDNAWNTHTIKDNTVDDRKIYYYKDSSGVIVPSDAGQVILSHCVDVIIQNLDFSNVENNFFILSTVVIMFG